MKCKEAQLLVAGLTGDILPETLAAHVEACPACAELLAVDARLRATLRSQPPVPSPYVLGRIRQEIATSKPLSPLGERGWGEGTRRLLERNTLMKITLPALSALAVATALVALPHRSDAATPLATFAKMKRAVLAQAPSMTALELKVGKTPEGAVGAWVVIDGELTQLAPNGSFHTVKDGKDITVTSSVDGSPDLSRLSPAQRALVQKAIRDAMSGKGGANVTTTYTVNGQTVDEATAKRALHDNGVDLSVSIDLDEDDYRAIAFGTDHRHLVLVPKSFKGRRAVVTLDPKTSLPLAVAEERSVGGVWKTVRTRAIRLG